MRKLASTLLLTLIVIISSAQDLKYYLPDSLTYDASIPKPKDIIFHEVGEYHVTHDRLVNYMQAVAGAAPNRVRIETFGFTYENRPQVLLTITSKKNLDRLEEIRQQHLSLTDPSKSGSLNISRMPVVVYIGHSIHGNEPSGANASLLTAYYLASAQGKQIDDLLDNTIILLDPSFNPDGLQRFSTWVNQHKGKNIVTDINSREFYEVWPGGRFNHYWFDLNRDWLPAVHPESQNRLKVFYKWKPNILTDHHEQGSNSTFFFQPGVPSRVNPLTPAKANELTDALGKYHAMYLDRIGSLYFTKENYDDFYYGKGSTFPDINGGIGILFEQASSRGHAQQTSNGILRFPATIKNQFITALSTLEGARNLRTRFLEHQREFHRQAINPSNSKGYVFGSDKDLSKTNIFIELLQRHQIEVRELSDKWNDNNFKKGSSYIVLQDQPQSVLIKAIFDKQSVYADSLFYDITSWTMPLAYGLKYKELDGATGLASSVVAPVKSMQGIVEGGRSDYAYIVEWNEFLAPKALYELLSAGLITKVASNPFQIKHQDRSKKFSYGTILVPVKMQSKNSEEVYKIMQRVATTNGIKIYSMQSGQSDAGSDLGSSKFLNVSMPSVAMLVGQGVNPTDAGEVWHLLDQRMNIPVTQLEIQMFNRTELGRYNTLIMVGGNYNDMNKDKLKAWVQAGGTLVLEEEAISWAAQNGVSPVSFKKLKSPVDSGKAISYARKEQIDGAQQMNGAIFNTEADLTHPLAWGYEEKNIPVFKSNKVYMERSKNPYATVLKYTSQPLLSGWASRENTDAIRDAAAVVVNTVGSGRIINIADNPNFRAFWLGGTKLMMNSIFFGRLIDAASARTED